MTDLRRRPKPGAAERAQRLWKLYDQGWPIARIAADQGVTRGRINQILAPLRRTHGARQARRAKERRQYVLQHHQRLTLGELARACGAARETIVADMRALGIEVVVRRRKPPQQGPWQQDEIDDLVRLWSAGQSLPQIADRLKRSELTVIEWLNRMGCRGPADGAPASVLAKKRWLSRDPA